ncbi:hypothetical protein Thi970DRAFT_00637 [Thiorhodovibrio frisius]|uniref:Small-conductance mechanosensitive channel n=2 Tax=Thiorhodovibrio frisius TaxID=631362 RepID=H8YX12_9GAMM|nr:hypothetical protein Thi970DRAFT_00637 [Thiorhodovibrio frisius]WPL22745.1 hypothetical protein Thiofri_02915 [Thiorhodovibrio frisius]
MIGNLKMHHMTLRPQAIQPLLLALSLTFIAGQLAAEPEGESTLAPDRPNTLTDTTASPDAQPGPVLTPEPASELELEPPPPPESDALATNPLQPKTSEAPSADELRSLEALDRALTSKEQQVSEVQQQLIAAEDSVTQQDLTERLRALKDELEEQRRQFEKFAVNIDLRPFIDEEEKPFNWQDELSKLLKPIIAELENATKESRAIGELRAQMSEVEERKTLATEATERLQTLLAQEPNAALQERLQERLANWQRIATDSSNSYAALELQLNKRLEQRQSMLEETTGYAKRFVRTRGLNLVLAIAAFALVFIGVRWLANALRRISPAAENRFSTRLTTLLLHVFSVLGGLIAMLIVFNMAGDWFMLGIILIFLIGIGWASINTLPSQIETVKLILNIGPVREGERLVFNGLPYRVESLAFTARLVNPLLDGGVQQMPVKHLVGHISRPPGEEEPWFPTESGDWVELADGRLGQVIHQSPASVMLQEPGGAEVRYPADGFIALNPRKLSQGFRIISRFGIDYRHQAIATTEVPKRMRDALDKALAKVLENAGVEKPAANAIKAINVLFAQASGSSLDYLIHLDLAGEAAPMTPIIQASIQGILIDACNTQGWGIPLTHVGVHQLQVSA